MDDAKVPEELAALDTPEGHQQFVRSQWANFAAFAWRRYVAEGRGAVVIDLRGAAPRAGGLHVPATYVADGGEKLARLGGWPDAETAQAVTDYDPEEEAVFLFVRLDGEVWHYVAADEPTPRQAGELS